MIKRDWLLTLRNLRHNLIAHPIAGVLWACGLLKAGDHVHSNY